MNESFLLWRKRLFCFLNSNDTTTQPPETTKSIQVEIVSRNANQTLEKNKVAIDDEMTMIPVLYGVLISISFFCMVCIIYRKGRKLIFLIFFVAACNPYQKQILKKIIGPSGF